MTAPEPLSAEEYATLRDLDRQMCEDDPSLVICRLYATLDAARYAESDPTETFSHPYRAPVVIDGHEYRHTSDCDWPVQPEDTRTADPGGLREAAAKIDGGWTAPIARGQWVPVYGDDLIRLRAALASETAAPDTRETLD